MSELSETVEIIEIRKSCMVCIHIDKGGYHAHCNVRTDIDLITVPFKRHCELFELNPNYKVTR